MATRNRYAEIMAQYAQSQPFSFTGYPSTYTGGYDATPYQAYSAPVNRYADIMAQPAMAIGGGGRSTPEAPSAWSQMTPAERAAYYAQHPIEGSLALGAQDALGWTSFGGLSKLTGPDAWYNSRLEKMGVNPTISLDTQNSLGGFSMQKALDSEAQSKANAAAAAASAAAAAQAAEQGDTSNYSNEGRNTGGGGGRYSGNNSGLNAGWGSRDAGGLAKGGHVSMQNLLGPDPEGPDDGYAALKDGEFVINDKAVKKYGIELMHAINSGKISKGKLRGLLEM
jgi:hypothetical protein